MDDILKGLEILIKAALLAAGGVIAKEVIEQSLQKEFKITHEQAATYVALGSLLYQIANQK